MFTNSSLNILTSLFTNIWNCFQLTIPGTVVTFGALALGCIGTVVAIKIFNIFFGIPFGFLSHNVSSSGGNNRNIKVSQNRKGDQK